MDIKKILLTAFFSLGLLLVVTSARPVNAVVCSSTTISSTCEFQYAKDGFDSGDATNDQAVTVSSGTLIIGSSVPNQELAIGKLILNGGAVTIYDGAKLHLGAKIWMVDQDADGYPASTTHYIQEVAPANGRRKAAMTLPIVTDCDDTQSNVRPNQTGFFTAAIPAGGPKAGTFDYNCDNVITKQYTSSAAYACNTTGCADHYYTVVSGWADGSNPACGTTEAYRTASYGTCASLSACNYGTTNYAQGCK